MNRPHPLIFIRHGQTPWNAKGLYQGVCDTELSSVGMQQAKEHAEKIRTLIENRTLDIEKLNWVTSPLKRARQTTQIIQNCLKVTDQAITEPAFAELSMGRWQGLTTMEVKDRFYEERKMRKTDRWNFAPQGGESMADRHEDLLSALERLAPHTVIVTHSQIIRMVFHIMGGHTKGLAASLATAHTQIWLWDGAILHTLNA